MPFEMDQRCLKCPIALVCVTQLYRITLLRCEKCRRKLAILDMDDVANNIIYVKCDRLKFSRGRLCEQCKRRTNQQRLS